MTNQLTTLKYSKISIVEIWDYNFITQNLRLLKITNAIRNIPFGQNSDESIASKYSSLVQNTPQTEATKRELAKPEVKESRDRKFRLTKESRTPQVSSSRGHRNRNFVEMSVRSKSSAELGQGFIMTYQKWWQLVTIVSTFSPVIILVHQRRRPFLQREILNLSVL